jgi:inositol oxygenase
VRAFNSYDLYSKSAGRPDAKTLRPYYESLIAEYFPAQVSW